VILHAPEKGKKEFCTCAEGFGTGARAGVLGFFEGLARALNVFRTGTGAGFWGFFLGFGAGAEFSGFLF